MLFGELTAGYLLLGILLGLVFGSFGSVIVTRLPRGESLGGRSKCPQCGATLSTRELIPLLSYAVQGGRCRHCRTPISLLYPGLELATVAVFFLGVVLVPGLPLLAFLFGIILWLLLLVAIIDARDLVIPDALSIPLIILSALFAYFSGNGFSWQAILLGAGFFAVQWAASRGKWVGSGDIFLGAVAGILLVTPGRVLIAIGISYVLGASTAILLLGMGKTKRGAKVPFGPFLILGILVVLIFGGELMTVLGF